MDVGNFRNINGLTLREIVARIPKDAVPEPWAATPGKAEHGMKWKWVDPVDGVTRRFRIHSPYPSAQGPNARAGWVARLQHGKNKYLDPKTGEFKHWKEMSDAARNRAHIPIADNPLANRTVPRVKASEKARRAFAALDRLADHRRPPRVLTSRERVQEQRRSGSRGRLAQALLGEKRPSGTYDRYRTRTTVVGDAPPGAQPRQRGPLHLTGNKLSRPGPLNAFLEKKPTAAAVDRLYREAVNKRPNGGPVKLGNGQTWYVNPRSGAFRPLSGPGVLQLTGSETNNLHHLKKMLDRRKDPIKALSWLSRRMRQQRMQLSPDMARALKVMGKARRAFLPEEIAATLKNRMPKLGAIKRVPPKMLEQAKTIANGRSFKIVKYGGRALLVVALASGAYEIYVADNKVKATAKVAGGLAGGTVGAATAAKVGAPLLAFGPGGWIAYGVFVGGSGVLGYLAGEQAGETLYEFAAE